MEKEVNCINSRAILNYVKTHNNGDCSGIIKHLDPKIDRLPDPESFLTDSNNWISNLIIVELFKKTRIMLNDEMAAYKIAGYAIKNTDLGFKSLIVRIFGSYHRVLKNVQRINAKWNKSKRVELVKLKRNEAIIRLHWSPQMNISKDSCLYNQGIYTFMPILWGGEPLTLEEKCCYIL